MRIRRPAAVLIGLVAAIVPASSVFAAGANVVYNSLAPAQGNIPSVGGEAYQFGQVGNEITMTQDGATLASATVTLSSWACQTGSWTTADCASTPGAKYNLPITINFYGAPGTDPATQPDQVGSGLPGALIATVTKTFAIPYRPSMNATKCSGSSPYDGLGAWWDSKNQTCQAGMMTNITFNLKAYDISLPQTFVYGIAYNTSGYGAVPYGYGNACNSTEAGCFYDSLNVGLSNDPANLNAGTDPYPGSLWWDTSTAANYCDGGAAGTGTFRFDSPSTTPCWGGGFGGSDSAPWFVPAVKFVAQS
jgi:hypothetical protein